MVRVWDPFVRAFHWALAASFAVAWLSSERWESVHDAAGYIAAALVALRLAWGFVGPHYARFAQFVRSPRTVVDYLRAVRGRSEPRYVGHNPAGGAMIVVLIAGMAATALTGWLLTTDALWGSETLQRLHSMLAHAVLALVIVHLGGVALASLRHRENLVHAMVVGVKRPAEPGDIA